MLGEGYIVPRASYHQNFGFRSHVWVGYPWQNMGLRPGWSASRNTSEHNFGSQPAQIPACGIPAPGSSEGLAAATQFAIPRREVSLLIIRPDSPEKVSYAGCVLPSVPSPCERRDRLRVLWTDPTPCNLRRPYLTFRFGLPECDLRSCQGLPSSRRFSSRIPRS